MLHWLNRITGGLVAGRMWKCQHSLWFEILDPLLIFSQKISCAKNILETLSSRGRQIPVSTGGGTTVNKEKRPAQYLHLSLLPQLLPFMAMVTLYLSPLQCHPWKNLPDSKQQKFAICLIGVEIFINMLFVLRNFLLLPGCIFSLVQIKKNCAVPPLSCCGSRW